MSIAYEVHKTIDHANPNSHQQYERILREWKRGCIKKVASRKARQKGGRTLRRELQRRRCDVDEIEDEENNRLIHEFTAKDRTISTLYVTFENFEPEPAE